MKRVCDQVNECINSDDTRGDRPRLMSTVVHSQHMKTFAVKEKRSAPVIRRSQPSRFGYRGPAILAQQANIHGILHTNGVQPELTVG